MSYLIKKEVAEKIKNTFRGQYFIDELGISKSYLSLVLTRKKKIPKRSAFAFTKLIDKDGNVLDYFDMV